MAPTIIVFLFCLTLTLFSQESQDYQKFKRLSIEELFDVDIISASRKSEKISDAPATIISITAEHIRKNSWKDLKDIFKALPGFDVSYHVQGELKTLVVMRGVLGNQKILILQDGLKYSPTTGERFIYGHNIPLSIYKRIEIIYGPASALYGADAYSGIINLITKGGVDYDGFEVNTNYHSTGATSADLTFGKIADEETDIILFGRVFRGEDFNLHRYYNEYEAVNNYTGWIGQQEQGYPIKNWNLFFKVRYKNVTLGGDWQHQLESNAPSVNPQVDLFTKKFLWGQDLRHAYLSHLNNPSNDIQLKTTVSVGDYEINPASNFMPKSVKSDTSSFSFKYGYSAYLKADIQLNWEITDHLKTVSGVSHEWVLSFPKTKNLDFNGPWHQNEDYEDDLSYFVDERGNTFGVVDLKESTFGLRNYENTGFFTQAEYSFTHEFKTIAGFRFDYNTIYKETFNPRLGIIYQPTEKLTLKALYGEAFIQPSNYYRWENWAIPFTMHIPNLNIRPEELTNYSANIIYYYNEHWSVTAGVYLNQMKDIIRPVIVTSPQTDSIPYFNPLSIGNPLNKMDGNEDYTVTRNENKGTMESKGGEITIHYKRDEFLASVSYSYVTGDDGGFEMAKISNHKIHMNTSYHAEKYAISLNTRYYSEVHTSRDNSIYGDNGDHSYTFQGGLILYLNSIYHFTPRFSANLYIENLLDTKHYSASPYQESIWILHRAPQSLRTWTLGINYKL